MLKSLPLALAVVFIAFSFGSGFPQADDSPYYQWSRPARGTIHAHSIYSNDITYQMRGMIKDSDHLIAEDVEAMIKRSGQLDLNFLLLQDHGEKLTLGHWYREAELERDNDTVNFAGYPQRGLGLLWVVRGFEWTQGSLVHLKPVPHKAREGEINHVGVFRSGDFTGTSLRPETGMTATRDLTSLYQWLLKHDPNKVFCSFNHPSYGSSQFNSFTISPGMERIVDYFRMIEVGSGSSVFYEGPDKLERYYRQALRQGWRLMPAIGADNPGKLTYQNARKRHTAVWVDNVRGQHPFFDHVRECCGFASEDEDAVAEIWLTGAHQAKGLERNPVMGQTDWLPCEFKPTEVNFRVYEKERAEGWSKVVLVWVRSDEVRDQVLGRTSGNEPIEVEPADICVYLKAIQLDGDYVITAPIWFAKRELLATARGFHQLIGKARLRLSGVKLASRDGLPVLPPRAPRLTVNVDRTDVGDLWKLKVRWEKVAGGWAAYYDNPIEETEERFFAASYGAPFYNQGTARDWCGGQFPDPWFGRAAGLEGTDTCYRAVLYLDPTRKNFTGEPTDIVAIQFYVRPTDSR